MTHILPAQALSRRWHQEKYAQPTELLRCDTQRRVAHALAQVEPVARRAAWAKRFEAAMRNGLLPGGRIMAGAGVQTRATTLMNCFVVPARDLPTLWPQLRATLRAGGGVGMDLSDLPTGVLQAMEGCEAVACSLERPPPAQRRAAQIDRAADIDAVGFRKRLLHGLLKRSGNAHACTERPRDAGNMRRIGAGAAFLSAIVG